jgi:hypothetical protein
MSNRTRLGLVVATVVVLVLAFVVLSPGDDDSDTAGTTTSPPATASTTATTDDGATTTTTAPPPDREPAFQTIRVTGGKPAGGIKKITLKQGAQARIQVTSPDTTDEIHLHGYDLKRDLKAGGRVRFSFKADAEGIFEIELEGAGTQIGELRVEP